MYRYNFRADQGQNQNSGNTNQPPSIESEYTNYQRQRNEIYKALFNFNKAIIRFDKETKLDALLQQLHANLELLDQDLNFDAVLPKLKALYDFFPQAFDKLRQLLTLNEALTSKINNCHHENKQIYLNKLVQDRTDIITFYNSFAQSHLTLETYENDLSSLIQFKMKIQLQKQQQLDLLKEIYSQLFQEIFKRSPSTIEQNRFFNFLFAEHTVSFLQAKIEELIHTTQPQNLTKAGIAFYGDFFKKVIQFQAIIQAQFQEKLSRLPYADEEADILQAIIAEAKNIAKPVLQPSSNIRFLQASLPVKTPEDYLTDRTLKFTLDYISSITNKNYRR